jgi:hypothetical protein
MVKVSALRLPAIDDNRGFSRVARLPWPLSAGRRAYLGTATERRIRFLCLRLDLRGRFFLRIR